MTRVHRVRPSFHVYILSSLSGTLYVGMTDDLPLRLLQHRDGAYDGFTRKYKVDRLMYYETFDDPNCARTREKQIKAYARAKKVALIEAGNPAWRDLGRDLYGVRRAPSARGDHLHE